MAILIGLPGGLIIYQGNPSICPKGHHSHLPLVRRDFVERGLPVRVLHLRPAGAVAAVGGNAAAAVAAGVGAVLLAAIRLALRAGWGESCWQDLRVALVQFNLFSGSLGEGCILELQTRWNGGSGIRRLSRLLWSTQTLATWLSPGFVPPDFFFFFFLRGPELPKVKQFLAPPVVAGTRTKQQICWFSFKPPPPKNKEN